MKALRYFFCVVLPPLAVLMTGRMGSFFLSILLTLLGWIPGVIHACLVVNDYPEEQRAGRFSPIMKAVISDARTGKLVLGTCNGFQVLCEAGLLPGALVRNRSLRFVCEMVTLRVEVPDSPFTHGCPEGTVLRMPIAHGEGCYFADAQTLHELNHNRKVIMRYADDRGRVVPEANPNGSIENIAGICNREGNVFGLMPHPDRACDARLGSADGVKIFQSMMQTIEAAHVRAA